MTNQNVFNLVFNALARREGRKTTLPTLVSLTGLAPLQVQGAIANARRTNETYREQIKVIKIGREWQFNATAAEGNNYPSVEDVKKDVEMGSTHIWKRVLKALTDRQGKIVSKQELADAASTQESPITPQQAANAMLTILRQPLIGDQIKTIKQGTNWRYNGPPIKDAESAEPATPAPVSSSIRGSVYRYVVNYPNKILTSTDIATDLGFTHKQVQNAMYDIVTGNADFTIVQRGNSWLYNPRAAAPATVPHIPPAQTTNGHAPVEKVVVPSTPPAQPVAAPPSAPVATTVAGRLFEQIGTLGGDDILLKEADSGEFYRATPLK